MKIVEITKKDVLRIARLLKIPVNKEEIQELLKNYKQAQIDYPHETWDSIVKEMLYEITEPREHEFQQCEVCKWYGIKSELIDNSACPECGAIIVPDFMVFHSTTQFVCEKSVLTGRTTTPSIPSAKAFEIAFYLMIFYWLNFILNEIA